MAVQADHREKSIKESEIWKNIWPDKGKKKL